MVLKVKNQAFLLAIQTPKWTSGTNCVFFFVLLTVWYLLSIWPILYSFVQCNNKCCGRMGLEGIALWLIPLLCSLMFIVYIVLLQPRPLCSSGLLLPIITILETFSPWEKWPYTFYVWHAFRFSPNYIIIPCPHLPVDKQLNSSWCPLCNIPSFLPILPISHILYSPDTFICYYYY